MQIFKAKMFSFILIAILAIRIEAGIAQNAKDQKMPTELNSPLGRELLDKSEINQFVDWSVHYECQENLTYCGVASGAMSLNLAGVNAPPSSRHPNYKIWTQENFLSPKTEGVLQETTIRKSGMSLSQFSDLLKLNGLSNFKRVEADSVDLASFRDVFVQSMRESKFIVVNYDRKKVGQKGGGHFSPVVAYSAASDQFLILDVARYRYAPVWISTTNLFEACNTVDNAAGTQRGFVIFSKVN